MESKNTETTVGRRFLIEDMDQTMGLDLEDKALLQYRMNQKLEFQQLLQSITNKINATQNIDEILLNISKDLCGLFMSDRLTIYLCNEDSTYLVSKVKMGLDQFADIRVPINEESVTGYVAVHRKVVNIADAYDGSELRQNRPPIVFMNNVDLRTGYKTRQLLVAPIVEAKTKELIGVIQVINHTLGRPFPGFMAQGILPLCEALAIALRQRQRHSILVHSKYRSLVTKSFMSAEDLEDAQLSARRKNKDIESILTEDYNIRRELLGASLVAYYQLPYQPFKKEMKRVDHLFKHIGRDFCELNMFVPIEENSDAIVVATLDPEKVRASRLAQKVYPKQRIDYRVTTVLEFNSILDLFFEGGVKASVPGESIEDLLEIIDDSDEEEIEGDNIVNSASDNEIVKLVNRIIIDAYEQGVSDIHIEPYPGKNKTEVRFRKDGALYPYIQLRAKYRNSLIARLKIMCDLDISERRKPQDGKIDFKKFAPLNIELRVATIPTSGGVEDVVMRILASGEPIPIDRLGLSAYNLKTCKSVIEKPYGLFFVCGPTGSGKTTTLHSVLGYLNKPHTKIWTAEDPVEITQKGMRQVQVNRKAGLEFSTVMRAFLRADPDIIMVGEMRDKETVSVGIEASLTGHLVFATLHTNSAPESISRLLDMGMDPFNFADALLGVLAQRLARRLCDKCKVSHIAPTEEVNLLFKEYVSELISTQTWKNDPVVAEEKLWADWKQRFADESGRWRLFEAKGCDECSGTGYKGRVGLHELLVASDKIKQCIQEHVRVTDMLYVALEEGMRTLKQDGIEKVLMGITDMLQVHAVCSK